MNITLSKSWTPQTLPTGLTVEPGGTVEVPDTLGRSLCEQPDKWSEAKKPKKD